MVWNDNHETIFCLLGLRLRNALSFWNDFFGKKRHLGGATTTPP